VDAKVVTLNLTPSGDMDVPKSPELVGWYDFTAKPGLVGNAVISGHLDWHDYGPAVFWKLKDLSQGDQIAVELADGTVITYAVTTALSYSLEDLPMAKILAPTASESVTLITCGGAFSNGEYSDRLVVRAVRTGISQASHH
jgi:LPXTG-site transpeptidase (sortase) family protein